MATETQPRTLEAENSEALINAQLKRTRSQVKSVEFGQRILKLIVGVLIFFLLATLLDHWVVSEGLPIWARVILWLSLIGGILWYATKALLPLLLYRVNPLYAARTIEETKPSLKNSLINYLTLSSEQDRLPSVIYDAIAKQAATGVKDASVDHAVDHAPLIRWGYLLLGLTFCFALYFVVSPKNPFRTVARVVVPWADLTAPSRVQIVEVTPGSTQLYRGKTVKIEARIEGLDDEETATLFYTTADGQQREQPINLKLDDLRNYTALLPAPAEKAASPVAAPREMAGLQQDFEYYIMAGDARSKTYRVQVAAAPYIGVERIEYKYPAYTKRPAETRQGEVNVEALEGTVVTIHGTANQPLKRAWIELRDNTGKPQKSSEMKITEMAASGSWTLGLKAGTREQPDFSAYALKFRNQQGDENPEPIAYPVKVIADELPTIDILAPSSAEISVPWDQPIEFEVRAQDPDFGLVEVKLIGMRGDKIVFNPNIASYPAASAHQGNLQKKYAKSPKELSLQVGDIIDYWVTATDNKFPGPNVVQTVPRKFRVIEAQRNNKNDALADNQQKNKPNDPQDKNQQRDNKQQGKPGDQTPPNGEQPPMGNQGQQQQGQPGNDANNGQGQPASDPTKQNNQDPTKQQNGGEQRPQPKTGNDQQNTPPQDPTKQNPQENNADNTKQQGKNGGEAGAKGSQQNGANSQKDKNDSNQGNKSGEPQPNGDKPNDGKNNSEKTPMNGAGQDQPQKGNQGNEQKPNTNQGGNKSEENGKQGSQAGGQDSKPEQQQSAGGRPQEQNKKVNSDGSQDADAIQQLKEIFEKNQKPPQEQASNSEQSKPNNGQQKPQDNSKQQSKPESGKPEQGNKSEPGQPEAGKSDAGKEPGKDQNGQQQSGKQESGNKQEQSDKQSGGKEGGKQEGQASPNKEPSSKQNGNNKTGETGKQEGNKQDNSKQPADPKNAGQSGEQKQPDASQSGQKQTGEQSPAGGQKADPMKQQEQPGPGNQAGEQSPGKAGPGENPEAGAKAEQGAKPDPNGKEPGDMGQEGNRQSPEKNKPGANAKDSNSQGSKSGNTTEPENRQSPKNDQQQSGKSDPNSSPEAQKKGKPNDNASNSNPDGKSNKEQSPSNQANDSASTGEEAGDKSGGGKQGGGQQENKPGRGASGSNTEDEKGANAGKQKGDGETGTKAGDQKKSADKTGKSGNETGNGTEQKPGDGKQPGGEPGKNKSEGKPNEPGKQPGEPGGQPNSQTGPPQKQKGKNGPAGNMPGGGGNSDAPAIPPEHNGPFIDTPEDKANDAYAKKSTDFVLEQLKKQLQSGNVDQEALNKVGWSKEDAQNLVNRWEALQREAEQPGPAGAAAAAKLQEKLRSLGLRPQQSSNTGENLADDTQRGNRVNRRSAPPSEYRDIYRAFQKGASGG